MAKKLLHTVFNNNLWTKIQLKYRLKLITCADQSLIDLYWPKGQDDKLTHKKINNEYMTIKDWV